MSRYSGAQWPSMQGAMKIFDTSTNVRPTNVGHYKGRTVQTSDWYKPRISTNVGLVQTSDKYKRRTSTKVGPAQTSDGYIYKFEKNAIAIRNK